MRDVRPPGAISGPRRSQTMADRGAGVGVVDLLDAGLAVDAEAELGLAVRDARLLGRARDGAGVERHADGAGRPTMRWAARVTAVEVGAFLGQRAGDLVDEEGAGEAAGLRQVGLGDVVVDDDHRDLEAEGARALGGEAEVQPVAGVVLDDEQAPGRAGDGEDAGEHRVDRGRGEDVAADRGGQHAGADEAGVRRLVAGAAAGDQRDAGAVPVGADDDADVRVAVEAGEAAAGERQKAVDGLGDDGFLGVEELGHLVCLTGCAGRRRRRSSGFSGRIFRVSPGLKAGVRVGDGDDLVAAEGEVQAGLVAEPLDAADRARLALALADLLGAEADRDGAGGGVAEEVGGQDVDLRLAEAARRR